MSGVVPTVLASLVVYAAGSFAAPAAGWEGVRFAYDRGAPPPMRTLLVAAVEAFVGFGTAALGVWLSTLTARADSATLVAAAAVGLGFGIARSLASARRAGLAEEAAREAAHLDANARRDVDLPAAAEAIGSRLQRIIRFAVTVRALAAVTVPLAAVALG